MSGPTRTWGRKAFRVASHDSSVRQSSLGIAPFDSSVHQSTFCVASVRAVDAAILANDATFQSTIGTIDPPLITANTVCQTDSPFCDATSRNSATGGRTIDAAIVSKFGTTYARESFRWSPNA